MKTINRIIGKLTYEMELSTQLFITIASGWVYGIIESLWIPTDGLRLRIFGMWSFYHMWLMILMFIATSAISIVHIQEFVKHKKKYLMLMCVASLPLALMIEDISWYVTRFEPILRGDWTMGRPGLGLNIGITWIPLWYFCVTAWSTFFFWLAWLCSEKGYAKPRKSSGRRSR